MQALLEHSQKNYTHLPSELCARRRRSRTSSRASPYPSALDRTISPTRSRPSSVTSLDEVVKNAPSLHQAVLQQKPMNANVLPPVPALKDGKHSTSFYSKEDKPLEKSSVNARQRVMSGPRRNGVGLAKKNAKSSDQKENVLSAGPSMK